jgi:hypothetical protein
MLIGLPLMDTAKVSEKMYEEVIRHASKKM